MKEIKEGMKEEEIEKEIRRKRRTERRKEEEYRNKEGKGRQGGRKWEEEDLYALSWMNMDPFQLMH